MTKAVDWQLRIHISNVTMGDGWFIVWQTTSFYMMSLVNRYNCGSLGMLNGAETVLLKREGNGCNGGNNATKN